MRKASITFRISLLLPIACGLLGCGSTAPEAPKKPSAPPAAAPAKPAAATPAPEKPTVAAARPKRERSALEKTRVAALFQVPEYTRPASSSSNYESRGGANSPPTVRFLGFGRAEGNHRQALIELKGEVLAVEQGDVVDGVEVVGIDDSGISLQYFAYRWNPRLFERDDANTRVTLKRSGKTAESVAAKLPPEIPVPTPPPASGGEP